MRLSAPVPGSRAQRGKVTALAACVALSLTLSACGIGGDGRDEHNGLAPGDYTIVSAEGVTDSVVVNGKIAPVRAVSITTPVQSEVEQITVAPGDRVQAEQLLASLNTEQLERQLAVQERQQANAQAEAMAGVQQAQAQLNALDNTGSPAVRQAQAQLNQAQAAYNAAVAANGGAWKAVRIARAAEDAAKHLSSKVGEFTGGPGPGMPGVPAPAPQNPAPQAPQAPAPQAPGAPQEFAPGAPQQGQPETIDANTAALYDTGGVGAGLSVSEAYAALEEAKANVAAAQAQAEQERMAAKAQLDSAWRSAEMAQLGSGDGTLEYQVQAATIYAPIAGVVTSVDVQEGDIPQGKILSLADDSRLLIRADVREADVPNIAVGNKVTFTSTATGTKEYTGRVARISPAAGGSADAQTMPGFPGSGGAGAGESNTVTFPVEIEVTGDTQGLLLGGSARAEIITQQADNALSVPLDAVYDDGGKKKVLVLATGGDDARSGTVEERMVTTGAENDVDVAVTGGDLKAGDIVLNWPDDYRDRIGDLVEITDDGFDPAEVAKAREKKQRTTATVTVTSTHFVSPEEAATEPDAPAEPAQPNDPAAAAS